MSTKDDILAYLGKDSGCWVSGEHLSRRLGLSRSAVSKHVRSLRKMGYVIESRPRRGYVLQERSPALLPAEIRHGLQTAVFGKQQIQYFVETDSTNTRARKLALEGAPEGTLVAAETQTGGKGRLGRAWYSPTGRAVYLSLILRPRMSPLDVPKITLIAAVAAAEAVLAVASVAVRIKWPNDLLVHGKKIAGILTEAGTEADVIGHVIVGLGLNVNTEAFPAPIRNTATSLFLETGVRFSRTRLVREYLNRFEKAYVRTAREGFAPVMERWKALSDALGRQVAVEMLEERLVGRVRDIDADGFLVVEEEGGRLRRVFSGDVFYL